MLLVICLVCVVHQLTIKHKYALLKSTKGLPFQDQHSLEENPPREIFFFLFLFPTSSPFFSFETKHNNIKSLINQRGKKRKEISLVKNAVFERSEENNNPHFFVTSVFFKTHAFYSHNK